MKLVIGHMYPELLNLYGDRGNIITLKRRCEWRGIEAEIKAITVDTNTNFKDIDILFLGGGSDREQKIVSDDLTLKRAKNLKSAIEDGLTLLSICGGYQLLGMYYLSSDGSKLPGIGALEIYTVAGNKRMIDNIIIESSIDGKAFKMVGFENHSGKTFLQKNVKPLGKVIYGNGNNGEDGMEGAIYKNTFGTYLHGPVLPKNPEFTDILIKKALERKYGNCNLTPLDDSFEHLTQDAIINRFVKK
ncbi:MULTISPECIES: type 1 glutamine amidotransferase [Thermoanaerobacterium]|uniref:Lipid II isoglutaminyl synthase (glutamine-hydrolyzing) subunit GatD n=2 Tax=Thermoanaerobacterium TaxID=28895 RepID=W9EFB1_9THEO|nr:MULTISPECIES: glutamine amidotransferase [Thermoanaerobacterium]AFK85583.1 CobB/CobQ domain protein glutamine amidotransferase [Thermoanaerobacterium saccharolyticum JW/SL-YS485]ETO39700.1 CobB/CobQ domain-containing protein glutamine amidotransferase [Thermoanaerobacterium aotearoense SCUT27]